MKICVIVPVGQKPFEIEVSNFLTAFQKFVGGGMVGLYFTAPDLVLVYNKEALINGYPGNRYVDGKIVFGNFFVVGSGRGDLVSLNDNQVATALNLFKTPETFSTHDLFMCVIDPAAGV